MGDKFNPKEDSRYLQYLDVNNLYDRAMIQKLSTGGFNWVDPSEFTPDKIDSYANCVNEGYLLEVMLSILKNYMTRVTIFLLCVKR